MGLDTSHNAFHGSYFSFNRFRQIVAKATGGSYPPHENKSLDDGFWYFGDGYSQETHPGLYIFFCHSDCEGEMSPEECRLVAKDLQRLLPSIEKLDDKFTKTTKKFIDGCLKAAESNEPLEFR